MFQEVVGSIQFFETIFSRLQWCSELAEQNIQRCDVPFSVSGDTGKSETNDTSIESPDVGIFVIGLKMGRAS